MRTTVLLVVALTALASGFTLYFKSKHRADHLGELWRQAEAALAAYEFAEAQTRLAAIVEAQPDTAQAHFLLAQAYRRARREDFEQARTHLLAAQRLGWPDAAIAAEYALLEFQQHGTLDAREKALHGLLEQPDVDKRLIFEALVRGCLRDQRLEHAARWLERWVAAYPDDWYAYLLRGTVWQHTDRPERAAADYDRVLRDKPDSADVKHRLGLALVQSGSDYPRALRCLEEHHRHHPDDADVLVGIARCRSVLNEPAAARPILQAVLAAHPNHAEALLALALVEADLGDDAAALRCLERLEPLAAAPPMTQALAKLWRLEPVLDSRSIPTRLQTVYQLQASLRGRLGQEKEARAYEQKLERHNAAVTELVHLAGQHAANPSDVALWCKMGELNLLVGLRDTGVYWLRRVLEVNPNDQGARRALAEYEKDNVAAQPR